MTLNKSDDVDIDLYQFQVMNKRFVNEIMIIQCL